MASSLLEMTARLSIDLHPSKSGDVYAGVRDQLNNMLMRYDAEFKGVVMAYYNERVSEAKAPIHILLPYITVKMTATFLVFRPKVSDLLEGVVNKVASDHLGLLVLGVFNASVALRSTKGAFEADLKNSCWVGSENYHHRIEVGSTVKFALKRVSEANHMIGLEGSLGEEGSGKSTYLKEQLKRFNKKSDGSKGDKVKKRKRSSEVGVKVNSVAESENDTKEQTPSEKPHKSKKRRKEAGKG
mmetsp:Transcript_15171/g.20939  ORF Transcript_15171/g.20939 Transcript_15171/m.20939 type:complete len:242 (-) Transcript_15171:118-843(-)|eukprot:CAMPEP_0196580118 /NCGR_PEP_ID=MMETSP1081-20130531/27188_1 /TAXON_ID=36882 /ORGANISM="Pyramimonas amylifera, Strain CCMP720" /LENGTH=241 /DNA_ID=CAMNT_0041899909 /DNA_START=24 /DNA_END=749 /DNA_ORIENTATION=+